MLLRALIHRPAARGRLRIGLRTRVRDGGCYLGIPRNEAFQGFRPSENTRSLQGPILDNAEHRPMPASPSRMLARLTWAISRATARLTGAISRATVRVIPFPSRT